MTVQGPVKEQQPDGMLRRGGVGTSEQKECEIGGQFAGRVRRTVVHNDLAASVRGLSVQHGSVAKTW